MDRPKASKARQRLRETEEARAGHLQQLLEVGAMIEGSFVTLGRTCGKPTCKCASGEKHYSKYLSRGVDGRTELTYVRSADEVEISAKAERYRSFRRARAELMKLGARTAELADELQAALVELYIKKPREARRKKKGRRDRKR